jgi:ElaB/YqjD/DUF883 family membrane-anchored ribosome-binding protein
MYLARSGSSPRLRPEQKQGEVVESEEFSTRQEQPMNPRSQSGYDPVGDPRTGRPPLPDERERSRRTQPDEIDPDTLSSSRSFSDSDIEDSQESGSESMVGKIASRSSEAAETLKSAGEAVSSQVSTATNIALERGQALASTASEHIQVYVNELVAFTRRKPMTALVGAALVGLLIGLLRRGRASD